MDPALVAPWAGFPTWHYLRSAMQAGWQFPASTSLALDQWGGVSLKVQGLQKNYIAMCHGTYNPKLEPRHRIVCCADLSPNWRSVPFGSSTSMDPLPSACRALVFLKENNSSVGILNSSSPWTSFFLVRPRAVAHFLAFVIMCLSRTGNNCICNGVFVSYAHISVRPGHVVV